MPKEVTIEFWINSNDYPDLLMGSSADGCDLELEIVGEGEPGSPGRTWGRPENCYPGEPGWGDIIEIYAWPADGSDKKRWTGVLTKDDEDRAKELIEAAAAQAYQDDYEDAMIEKAESRLDDIRCGFY